MNNNVNPNRAGYSDDLASGRATDWFSVGIVVACGVIAAFQIGKVVIAAPALRTEFGLSLGAVGEIMGVFPILGVFGGIPIGAAVERLGDKALLVLGLLAVATGGVAGAMSGNYATLLGSRVFEGAGFLLVTIAGPALLQRAASDRDRELALSLWSAYMPTGVSIALLCGSFLANWRILWFGDATAALIVLLMVIAVTKPGERNRDGSRWQYLFEIATAGRRSIGPLLLAMSFGIYSLQYFAMFSFLPVLLGERMGVSVQFAGILSAATVTANIFGNLASGLLLKRGAQHWFLVATASTTMALTAIGIFLTGFPLYAVFTLCIIFSGVGGILPAALFSSVPWLTPVARLRSISIALLTQGSSLGQVVAPIAIGRSVDAFGWSAAAFIVVIAGVAGVTIALLLRWSFARAASSGKRET